MNIFTHISDFFAGPCLYITLPLCFAGLVRKILIIKSGRRHGLRFIVPQIDAFAPEVNNDGTSIIPSVTFTGRNRTLAAASLIFHFALIAAPLTAAAHGILFDQAWGIMPPRFNPVFTGLFTSAAVITGMVLILRRTIVQRVSAVTSWKDYAAMLCVLVPFVTGYLAREMIGRYETVMFIHYMSAHILLIAIGWTRLGHMVFFTAGRFMSSGMQRGISS